MERKKKGDLVKGGEAEKEKKKVYNDTLGIIIAQMVRYYKLSWFDNHPCSVQFHLNGQ